MPPTYHVRATAAEAVREAAAAWRQFCADRGVTPEAVADGTQTVDTRGGRAALPPVTTAVARVVLPRTGLGGLLVHSDELAQLAGRVVVEDGVSVTIQSTPAAAVDRSQLPAHLAEALDAPF